MARPFAPLSPPPVHRRSKWLTLFLSVLALGHSCPIAATAQPPAQAEPLAREIFVPFDDLNVILSGPTRRVFISREQYEELRAKAKKDAKLAAPVPAALLSADYKLRIEQGQALLSGRLELEVFSEGLQMLVLDVGGVDIRSATLDGHGAPLARIAPDKVTLFVQGVRRHELLLELVPPLETAAAQQTLSFEVPVPPAARLQLIVPGNVEVKRGAEVIGRVVDEAAGVTRLELVPRRGPMNVAMSLNNRLLREDRLVVARSSIIDVLTSAYERLHVTASMGVLHGATDQFRFQVPEGFEVTAVNSPLVASWSVAKVEQRSILDVRLREATVETVVLGITATRTPAVLQAWSFPRVVPLDVAGEVAVLGLLVENRLAVEGLETKNLIAIDTATLGHALPSGVLESASDAAALRPVAAYYAPRGEYSLTASLNRPPVDIRVTTNVLLTLTEKSLQARGGVAILPVAEKLFEFDLMAPSAWQITAVTLAGGRPLVWERHDGAAGTARIHVRLPQGLPVNQSTSVYFQAQTVPKDWLTNWNEQPIDFPMFAVRGASSDTGAIAVTVQDDIAVRPDQLARLTPLDANEKSKYGLSDAATLAYRYVDQPYSARLIAERLPSRVTARTASFLRLEPELLVAHYEVTFDIRQARTRRLSIALPADTPEEIAIRGLGGLAITEYASEVTAGERRWNIDLADAVSGAVRLAVDFQKRQAKQEAGELSLPLVRALNVAYQSGLIAVEGSSELDVQVTSHPRRVDVGELAEAEYQVGRRLLGAFGFAGDKAAIKVKVSRPQGYGLPTAIVERAEMITLVAARGASQTAARYLLRTKSPYLEIRLPAGSTLWSIRIDQSPALPQRDGDSLIVSLPIGADLAQRDLQIVYETPVDSLRMWGEVGLAAPKLLLRDELGKALRELPVADLVWRVHLPSRYRLVRSDGTVFLPEDEPTPLLVSTGVPGLPRARSKFTNVANQISAGQQHDAYISVPQQDFEGSEQTEVTEEAKSDKEVRDAQIEDPFAPYEPAAPSAPRDRERMAIDERAAIAPRGEVPPVVKMPQAAQKKGGGDTWAVEGLKSLKIDLDEAGLPIELHSLGADPQLKVTVADQSRLNLMAIGTAALVLIVGLAWRGRPAVHRARFLLIVVLLALLIPLLGFERALGPTPNAVLVAAAFLTLFYLAVALWRGATRRIGSFRVARPAASTVVLLTCWCVFGAQAALAQVQADATETFTIPAPIHLPDDAVVVPYDVTKPDGVAKADKLLIPYARYVELWNQAYPSQRIETKKPPAPFALSGAAYQTTLAGQESLTVRGHIDLEVFADGVVSVPLALHGCVLSQAMLDGKPARLQVVQPSGQLAGSRHAMQPSQQAFALRSRVSPAPLLVLYAEGKGRKRLELTLEVRLVREGGWRIAKARVPSAPATALTITVPEAQTELRLGSNAAKVSETQKPGEVVQSAVAAGGALQVAWRPKITQTQVDRSLTVNSAATLDVEEDALRTTWRMQLDFRGGQRESFTFDLPENYLIEKVDGTNVRGWQAKAAGAAGQQLDVTLLKPASGSQQIGIKLARRASAGQDLRQVTMPTIKVRDAVLHQGTVQIRRSPALQLRIVAAEGVTRSDVSDANAADPLTASPLGLVPFQAFRFSALPLRIELAAEPIASTATARLETVLRVAERERTLESNVVVRPKGRPIYRVRIVLPTGLVQEKVVGPEPLEWVVTKQGERRLLEVTFPRGQATEFSLIISGRLGSEGPVKQVKLPKLEVLDVESKEGEIVVQADPALSLRATGLKDLEPILLSRTFAWLKDEQRPLARLAFRHRSADYEGAIEVAARTPRVSSFTVTNVNISDRAIAETILIELSVRDAGIRDVVFLLPSKMRHARISVPLLRQKTVTPAGGGRPGHVRVRLELQEDVIGDLRVLVEDDGVVTAAKYSAPLPIVETGRTDQRYVVLENEGLDEVVVDNAQGLERLSPQQSQWRKLAALLGTGILQAFLVKEGDQEPQLLVHTKDRKAVATVAAAIGLAKTRLVIDASGAYRAEQEYRVDNSSEQFLDIELPAGAELWTAVVAGEPVKPARVPGAAANRVRLPLVKTAAGDRDYAVVLKYAGEMPPLGSWKQVSFPLPRTINIQVEMSQVELDLPKSYRWFNFGGSMQLLPDRSELEAGYLNYNAKQIRRILSVYDSDGDYAKARAANNLKELKKDLDRFQQSRSYDDHSGRVQSELDANRRALEEAERQVVISESRQSGAESDGQLDNSARLNARFAEQKSSRAKNVVTQLGANFDSLRANKPNATAPAAPPSGIISGIAAGQKAGEANGVLSAVPGRARQSGAANEPALPQFTADLFVDGAANGQLEGKKGQTTAKFLRKQTLDQYKQKLEVQAKDGPSGGGGLGGGGFGGGAGLGGAWGENRGRRRGAMRAPGPGTAGPGPGQAATAESPAPFVNRLAPAPSSAPAPPTGLASLDVQLPSRGDQYFFTTPRGKVEITANTVADTVLARLARLGVVLVFLSVVGIVYRRVPALGARAA